jgi:hypothetical protein
MIDSYMLFAASQVAMEYNLGDKSAVGFRLAHLFLAALRRFYRLKSCTALVVTPPATPMKTTLKAFASGVTHFMACLVHVADSKPAACIVTITEIEMHDPSG